MDSVSWIFTTYVRGIEPTSVTSPALAGRLFISSATWKAHMCAKIPPLNKVAVYWMSGENLLELKCVYHF